MSESFHINNFEHKGKCDTCTDLKPIDEMVRKQYTKGLYECVDCKTDKEVLYTNYILRNSAIKPTKTQINGFMIPKTNKFKKALKWAIGQ